MQARLWWGAGIALAIALVAIFADRRRQRRDDLDRVGFMPWALIQVIAMMAAAICAALAML